MYSSGNIEDDEVSGISIRIKGRRDDDSVDSRQQSQADWIRQYVAQQEEVLMCFGIYIFCNPCVTKLFLEDSFSFIRFFFFFLIFHYHYFILFYFYFVCVCCVKEINFLEIN